LNNKQLLAVLREWEAFMELHDENPFKVRSLSIAIFNLRKATAPLAQMPLAELQELEGVGKSFAVAIDEINRTGKLDRLEKLRAQTPPGIAELTFVKGVGARKAGAMWRELGITGTDDALEACRSGRVAAIKGLGEKTQQNILEAILHHRANHGKFLYADAEPFVEYMLGEFQAKLPGVRVSVAGDFRRGNEIIDHLDFLAEAPLPPGRRSFLEDAEQVTVHEDSGPRMTRGEFRKGPRFSVAWTSPKKFGSELIKRTGSPAHLAMITPAGSLRQAVEESDYATEEEAYKATGLPLLPPELREGLYEKEGIVPDQLVSFGDLRGCLHNHSTWSDGIHTIEEMAVACRERGWEYFGICDHSKAAVYANGLDEARVREQWIEIDRLNRKMAPFRIFKGIEADILDDGSLDLGDALLSEFDFVVVSIHSGLGMDAERATRRLIKAISNPVTTMVGHVTGRLLLDRDGYPVDMPAIIDACARNQVIIEINAHPSRLDLDWRWVRPATRAGVMLSINPDAHQVAGMDMMRYGVITGRKGALTADLTLNTKSAREVEKYFLGRKKRKAAKR
jgi:DNA polymerase (family 10)